MNTDELLQIVHVNETAIACGSDLGACPFGERTLSYAVGIEIPLPEPDPDEIFKECCYTHYALADLDSSDEYRNDYSSFYHQRVISSETVEFFLYRAESDEEFELNDGTYGEFFNFNSFAVNPNLKGYLVKWKKVLAELGEGSYKIIKRFSLAGLDSEVVSVTFTLRQYSNSLSNQTVRIDTIMNGRLEKYKSDFTGINWKQSMRVPGFFGRREAQYEEDNLVDRQFNKRQISMKQTNEYKFQTNYIPDCISTEILDFMLFANKIFMNDYNLNNHSYSFIKFPVKFSTNEGSKYANTTRKLMLNLTFSDKFDNNLKRNYN